MNDYCVWESEDGRQIIIHGNQRKLDLLIGKGVVPTPPGWKVYEGEGMVILDRIEEEAADVSLKFAA